MGAAALRHLQLVIAAGVLAGVSSCLPTSLEHAVSSQRLSPAAIVRLSMDRAAVARRDDTDVEVIEFREEDGVWMTQRLARFAIGSAASSLNLVSLDGDTGDDWNTWVYGTAPESVSRVDLIGLDGEGGRVVDGAWVIVLRDRGLTPADVEWEFLDALGATVERGVGMFPPSS
jgi:hypothetical protein